MPSKKIRNWITVKEFKNLSNIEQASLVNKFKTLYIDDLLSIDEIINKLNINKKLYLYLKKEYNIKLTNNLLQKKKKKNNLKKYGIENYRNSEKIKQTWKSKTPEEINTRSNKIINTKLQKYGNKMGDIDKLKNSLNKNKDSIVEKLRHTSNIKYNRNNPSQRTINDNAYCILQNKELLKNEILKLGNNNHINDLANALNHHSSIIARYVKKYNLEYLIDYSKQIYHSKSELEIQKLLKDNNIDFKIGDRTQIKPLELDIYIPNSNVAIEFNGLYWHSSLYKDKDYHFKKSKLCEEKGIRLIHIWEYEWNNKRQRPILENIILSACRKIQNKIYARNCKIEVKTTNEVKEFFNKNNIQGFRGGKFAICLIYNDEVVMSYIMGSAYFGKGKYEWEVIRGATKLGITVIGGASKIWKYFKDNYNPKSCVYYVDYNYFNGKSILYLDDNFKFIKTQPSFKNWWVKENVIKNRDAKNHSKLKLLEKQGLIIPIYNAGTKVYVWEK